MTWKELRFARYRRHWKSALILLALVVAAGYECEVSWSDLSKGIRKGASMLALFLPPDWAAFPDLTRPALITLAICLVATPAGAALSLFVGLAGARNIAPAWLRLATRTLIAVERGVPEIVILLILVAAFGLGPFAGVMALSIGSVGMLGKLVADSIEEIDGRVMSAVAAAGATRWQVIRYVVIPEILPSLVSNSIFRFEVNIRASVLLGAVGAGGIGYELNAAINQFEYGRATAAAITTLAVVFLSERLSDFLRSRILAGGLAA